ncbi:uncharacterized protein Z518_02219 [Rhinocladiella mackenziei CBS 650.93]|uniref:Uncharacterized protein n=1 Tax=Rhinocladiella mackenziei CBS 650.93 TaxID=1442369 RepID=A0A0D2IWB3_9EURO|nr:uncharacterized protein Z518_02219 [Rhinocladiella mackenziei CBS 650.93]KIX07566.1 hypothetical protein Z518_02219 [Rhinocladiella mackenziei CBS 650.93]
MLVKSTAAALLIAVGSVSAAAVTNIGYGTETVVMEDPDFGLCIPTMKYEGGLGGRANSEFSFLPTDPLCARGQPEALNPNIITNRICDQLSTVCSANEAAKTLCRDAQAKIRALGTRNKSTADTWNTLLGFGGALTNPDGGATEPGAAVTDLKKRGSKRAIALIPCSTSEWIDTCTGWPAPEPVVKKRSLESAPGKPKKRTVRRAVQPPMKRSEKSKRQRQFVPCSTQEWIDECTGWP